MKKITALLLLLSLASCSNDDVPKDGDWDDIIQLSQDQVLFGPGGGSATITTEGQWWWVHGISLNGTDIDISGVDTTSDTFEVDGPGFTVRRENATELYIEMAENQSGTERTLTVGLEAGDYFDGIVAIQSAN